MSMGFKEFAGRRGRTLPTAIVLGLACGSLTGGLTGNARAQKPTRVFPTDLTNIAANANGGRIITATSVLDNDPKFTADNLIDGKIYDPVHNEGSPGWASDKFDPVNMDSVTIGFADNAVKHIGKIVLNSTSAVAPERWAKDIEVQVSTDSAEGPYRAVAQLTLRRASGPQEFTILPADARFVRLLFRSNWGSDRAVALGEVELYEAIGQDDPMGQLIARLESAIKDLQRFRDAQNETAAARSASLPAPRLDAATIQTIQMAGGDTAAATGAAATGAAATGTAATGAPSTPAGQNIAAAANGGKIVDSSSTFTNDPAYGPDKVIDGENYDAAASKGSNGWASEGFSPAKQYITIGFKDDRTHVISKFVLNPVSNQSTLRWARRVDVQVTTGSPKTGPFRTVSTLNLRPEPTNQDFSIRPVEAKYVRFVFMANGPGNIPLPDADPDVNSDRAVSIGEIEIYEAAVGNDTLDALIGRLNQVLIDLKRLRAQSEGKPGETNAENATLLIEPRQRETKQS